MKAPARRPLDFSLTEPPAVQAQTVAQNVLAQAPVEAPRAVSKTLRPEMLKQLNTRIPASQHQAFKIAALQESISVQDLLARLIDRYLSERATSYLLADERHYAEPLRSQHQSDNPARQRPSKPAHG
jgi:hypothetical protein